MNHSSRRAHARAATPLDPCILWLVGALLAASLIATTAFGQETQPDGTAQAPATGVIQPPAQVDPGIKVKPPLPSAALPTPIIPPPGTPGGNPSVQPK